MQGNRQGGTVNGVVLCLCLGQSKNSEILTKNGFDLVSKLASCSCQRFESKGILYAYSFPIFKAEDIQYIQNQYNYDSG